MIKRLYLVNGGLTKALGNKDADIAVDNITAQQLVTGLSLGDWCYLALEYQDNLEIIKVTKTPIELQVDRAQDNTTAKNFPVGSKIKYRLTRQEILDKGNLQTLSISADGLSGISISGYQISYKLNNPSTLGGIETTFEQDGEIVIRDKTGAFGCCDSNLTGAPSVGGQIFYLTSQLYAYITNESVTGEPKDKNGNAVPPLNLQTNFWLLDQPQPKEEFVKTQVGMNEWSLFGGAKSTVMQPNGYVGTSADANDWNRFGGAKSFTAPPEQFISTNSYPLEMQLFGNAVEYHNFMDQFIGTSANVLPMSLF